MKNPFRAMAVDRFPHLHHEHESYRWWVLGTVLITTFMSVLEGTVVNTALPSMQNSFGTSLDIIEWVLTAYQLVFAVVLPLSGWLADKMGYKRTFLLSLAIFTLGSLACSFAWNEEALIFFRVIQGAGGGMIMPVGMAIVTREFPPQQRGMAMGFYGIAAAASISIGPSLGGYLVDSFGWSSVFLINVPIGFVGFVAALLIQREYRKEGVGPFDFGGFISISVFLVALLLALADGNAAWNTGGWSSNFILTCFAVAAVGLVIFFAIELTTEHPIVDLRLFLQWNFGMSNIMLFMIGLLLMGSTFIMPVYFQGTLGYTALQSGLLFLPMGIIQGMVSPITGMLADKISAKIPAVAGVALLVVSFGINTLLSDNPPFWIIMLPICLRGVGFGLLFISLQSVSINSLPRDKMAQGSGLITLTRQIGSSFGVAIFGAVLTQRNIFHTAMLGESTSSSSEMFRYVTTQLQTTIFQDGGQTSAGAATLSRMVVSRQIASDAFVKSVDDIFVIVAFATLICLVPILALRIPKKTPGRRGGGHGQAPGAPAPEAAAAAAAAH